MFVNCQGEGMDIAAVDVIVQPPPLPPVAAPNLAMAKAKVPTQFKVLDNTACFTHNLATMAPTTMGPVGIGGVASGTSLGPGRHLKGSTCVILCGFPQTRFGDNTLQDATNAAGMTAVPSSFMRQVLA